MTTAPAAAVAPELNGQPAAAAPALVEVKVGNATLKLDKASADAITAYQKAQETAGVTTAAQLEEMKAQLAKLTPNPALKTDQPSENLADLVFTDPDKFAQRIIEQISSSLTAKIDQTNSQTAFWNEFYGANPELKAHDWMVRAIVARDYAEFKPLKVADAIPKLAERVKSDILKLGGKAVEPAKDLGLEGGNESARKPSKKAESEDSPTSGGISDVLKQRREARRKGAAAA